MTDGPIVSPPIIQPGLPAPNGIRWRAYTYDAMFTSAQGPWEAVTGDLLAVVWQQGDMPRPSVELGCPYYVHMGDWIARCWDPTLYLRKWGAVKFGRWAPRALFLQAWQEALTSLYPRGQQQEMLKTIEGNTQHSHVVWTGQAGDVEGLAKWWVYYDDAKLFTSHDHTWEELPSDGVLCACYHRVTDGIAINIAKRRYTFYYWAGDELANTDDMDHLLKTFPAIKRGRVNFDGLRATMPMAEIYKMALEDILEDIPWPT